MGYITSLMCNRDAKLKVEIATIQQKTDSISIDLVFVDKLLKIKITKEDDINPVLKLKIIITHLDSTN